MKGPYYKTQGLLTQQGDSWDLKPFTARKQPEYLMLSSG